MSNQPQIVNMPIKRGVAISSNCKFFGLPKTMKDSFKTLMKLHSKDLIAPPYTHYHNIDWENLCSQSKLKMFLDIFSYRWVFDCGIPVAHHISDVVVPVSNIEYDFDQAASVIHVGPYHKVGATYKMLYMWLKENGMDAQDCSFEIYLNDPNIVSAKDLQTQLLIPIKKK